MFLHLNLKQSIIVVTLIATLLVTLVAGVIRVDMTRSTLPGYSGSHGNHPVAMYCPPPPILC
jgi:hypothetical protein